MEKQRNTYIGCLIFLSLLFVTNIILFAVDIFKLWLFVMFSCAILALAAIFAILLRNILKRIKKVKEEQSKKQSVGDYNIDLYEILGIPVQYNKDGTVKNIYDLLGIEPMYDDKGNRILTIYELLQIMPKFNEKGEEIPTVVSIKNKVGRIAKVDISSRVLTRKLTEEEKEQIAIREALGEALKKAEAEGDDKKQGVIKGLIQENNKKKQQKKKEQKKESKPPEFDKPKYKLGKGGKAVGNGKINGYLAANQIKTSVDFSFIFDVFKKSEVVAPKVESPTFKPQPNVNKTERQSSPSVSSETESASRCIYVNINEEERGL